MTASTRPRLRAISARHRLVDRAGGEQVPGGDGVALADAVAAVLGLVVHRRGPLELEERDVGRARERDALGGDAGARRRSAAAVGPPGTRRRSPRAHRSSLCPAGAARRGKRSITACCTSTWRAKTTSGSPRGEEVVDPGQRARAACRAPPAAAACRAARAAAARSVAAIFAFSSERSSGCSRSQAITSSSASRYSRSLSSATGTTTWRLSGSCGSTSHLRPAHEAAAAQVPVQPLLASARRGTAG